jgi:hypothetical protein
VVSTDQVQDRQTDGRLEMTNNAAERAIRPLAMTRKNFVFLGSDAGGDHAAAMFTILESCKMLGINRHVRTCPDRCRMQHWVLTRGQLLPFNALPKARKRCNIQLCRREKIVSYMQFSIAAVKISLFHAAALSSLPDPRKDAPVSDFRFESGASISNANSNGASSTNSRPGL